MSIQPNTMKSAQAPAPAPAPGGFDINELVKQAQTRWLKPAEVLFILQNHHNYKLNETIPLTPPVSGSLFLYNKRVVRFFRKDGHTWRKKKSGRTVGEGHERLKVKNVETLNCYYAHGEENPNFQRRSYWMLDKMFENIVFVHYREIQEGRGSSGSTIVSMDCPSILSPGFPSAQNQGSISALSEPFQNQISFSPGSMEVSSELFIRSNARILLDEIGKTGEFGSSPSIEVNQELQRAEGQLRLNNNGMVETSPQVEDNHRSNGSALECQRTSELNEPFAVNYGSEFRENHQYSSGFSFELNGCSFQPNSGVNTTGSEDDSIWEEMLEQYPNASWLGPHSISQKSLERTLSDSIEFLFGSNDSESPTLFPLHQEVENSKATTSEAVSNYYVDPFNHPGVSLVAESRLTLSERQRFTVQEISPQWGYASDSTKVIIIGNFLCEPSECAWSCMFGDVEVPVQIIQGGVLCCEAPPHIPGKVTLCITSSNHESCSEMREFVYRTKPSITDNCSSLQRDVTRSTEELLLLVRFAQMLLCDPLVGKEDIGRSLMIDVLRTPKVHEDPWEHVIEELLVGSKTPLSTMDWLVEELLKDKLQQWLTLKNKGGDTSGCFLSKKEQGIIHMVAGLGFEWALNPILKSGININYRDVTGWTALHWASRYGREKMVGALIAAGASAVAVTDPTSQDPVGKTPASIADASGHKGLAGYLSEVALTSHLLSLTLEESDTSKCSASVEVERTIERISDGSLSFTEDHISLRDSLAAVRNATQAARRIQSAFREHSFRRRQQQEAVSACCEEYGLTLNDIRGLSASQAIDPSFQDQMPDKAARSIQKKYRGWKGRKEFLALRQKIVMIQANVRGYQVRKRYKVILWAVGVLDKAVLRWHRKRVGLRGFQAVSLSADESDYENILKVFQKQKVDATIEEALSQVLFIVRSPEARRQYRRMLESYWKAKAELSGGSCEAKCPQGSVGNIR